MTEAALPRELGAARLRRLRPGDLADFQAYRALPELGRFQGWTVQRDAEALAFLAEMQAAPLFVPGEWVQLGIAEAAGDRLVGDIGLHLAADGTHGEIGFTLAPQAQGRGIATAAVRAALELLFGASAAREVRGITDERNGASLRLLERVGFEHIGHRDVVFRGEACRERVYRLLRPRAADRPAADAVSRPFAESAGRFQGGPMEFHRGRLIDHVHLRVRDLAASKRFYRAVLEAIGRGAAIHESTDHFNADELWIDRADGPTSIVHLAFQAAGPEAVQAFHAAALAAGGRDHGAPGERRYHPGYYAAFVLDPDGNNIEAVYHGPAEVSAESVVVRPRGG